jgi:L-2-hydroxyglutarate oxidase LhgO
MEQTDCVVIGAGVVGLAIARELAARGRETIVLEAADAIGTGISSRNSEVIHAGLYYPRGSLKATSCVHGRDLLYRFCETHHVPHRRVGKLLVATSAAQVKQLKAIAARAAENGVLDLLPLTRAEAQTLEPALECVEALFSPETGIVDSHQLMLALLGDAQRDAATCALQSPVESIDVLRGGRFVVRTGGAAPTEIEAACVVNSAGLGAQALARRTRGLDPRWVPPLYLARGHYFSLAARAVLAPRLSDARSRRARHPLDARPGRTGAFRPRRRMGRRIALRRRSGARAGFYASIRAYWPGLPDGALQPAYAGIRPKLAGPGEPPADFVVQGPAQHGVRGLVNLFGIESPGLTAALALAQRVGDIASRT